MQYRQPDSYDVVSLIEARAGDAEPAIFSVTTGNYYDGINPVVIKVSGDDQASAPGSVLGAGFVVRVEDDAGVVLVNAPVTFSVDQGDGRFLVPGGTGGGAQATSLEVTTDASGLAVIHEEAVVDVFFRQPYVQGFDSEISVTAGPAPVVMFSASTYADSDGDGLWDHDELNVHFTDPNERDSDGDGVIDSAELAANTNPMDEFDVTLTEIIQTVAPGESVTVDASFTNFTASGDTIANELAGHTLTLGSGETHHWLNVDIPPVWIGKDATRGVPLTLNAGPLSQSGSYQATVSFVDSDGGYVGRMLVTMNVVAGPETVVTSPASGPNAQSGDLLLLEAQVSHPDQLATSQVEFFVDGISVGIASGGSPYTLSYTVSASNGDVVKITAKATDSNALVGSESAPVYLIIGDGDSDGDGISDLWENSHGLDSSDAEDAALDSDYDRLSNLTEYRMGNANVWPSWKLCRS